MARKTNEFTDKERANLRQRLRAHAARYRLSPQKISDQIVEVTGFATAYDGGRKRVERFLKAEKRQTSDFIAAVEEYLNQVASEDVEESAIAVARLFSQADDESADLSGLVGGYEAYLKPIKPVSLPDLRFPNFPASAPDWPKIPMRIAFARITMTPLERSNALLVGESVINPMVEPDITMFPEMPSAMVNAGVVIPFGRGGFLMVTKSENESRFCQLKRPVENIGRLVGFLTINGGEPKSLRPQFARRDFDPDYEVELVKVEDIDDA
ncbi:MAG: hypothetical protein ACEPO2_01995 [Pelagibaca sp.]